MKNLFKRGRHARKMTLPTYKEVLFFVSVIAAFLAVAQEISWHGELTPGQCVLIFGIVGYAIYGALFAALVLFGKAVDWWAFPDKRRSAKRKAMKNAFDDINRCAECGRFMPN